MNNARAIRALLIRSYLAAVDASVAYRDYLETQIASVSTALASGLVTESSGDGHTTSWASHVMGSALTLVDVQNMWVYLLELFDRAKVELIAGGSATPSDAEIKALMESPDYIRPVFGYTNNWTLLSK